MLRSFEYTRFKYNLPPVSRIEFESAPANIVIILSGVYLLGHCLKQLHLNVALNKEMIAYLVSIMVRVQSLHVPVKSEVQARW